MKIFHTAIIYILMSNIRQGVCGGLGTRLEALTFNKPKPMVEVAESLF